MDGFPQSPMNDVHQPMMPSETQSFRPTQRANIAPKSHVQDDQDDAGSDVSLDFSLRSDDSDSAHLHARTRNIGQVRRQGNDVVRQDRAALQNQSSTWQAKLHESLTWQLISLHSQSMCLSNIWA